MQLAITPLKGQQLSHSSTVSKEGFNCTRTSTENKEQSKRVVKTINFVLLAVISTLQK